MKRDEERVTRKFCVLFQFPRSTHIRIVERIAPSFINLVDNWSGGKKELVFRSNDAQQFAYFFQSSLPVAVMRSQFQTSPSTDNNHTMLLFEVGDEFDKVGFSQPAAWLLRTRKD